MPAGQDLVLQEELERQRERSRENVGPERSRTMEWATEELRRSGMAERAVKAGEPAPDFALRNVRGEEIRLGDLLGRGAVVLAFYRGGW